MVGVFVDVFVGVFVGVLVTRIWFPTLVVRLVSVPAKFTVANPAPSGYTLWSGAELRTRLWFICAAARETDPVLKAALEVLHEVWRADEPAPA